MLKKVNRLPATQKLKSPIFIKTQHFALKISKNNLSYSRFAFVVKKTLDKRAVGRNRVKRVLRSCIEEMLENIEVGWDMLFLLEKGIIDVNRQDVFNNLKTILDAKKLLR